MMIQQISVIDNWDFEGELYELVETPKENEEEEDFPLFFVLLEKISDSGIPFIINTGDYYKEGKKPISSIYIKIPSPPPELT